MTMRMVFPHYDRARMVAHDRAAYDAFPGPDFHEVLAWIHADHRPETYVEIGIHSGASLGIPRSETLCVGIDPEPQAEFFPANVRIFRSTSSEFFTRYDLRRILGGRAVDFALIDGLHRFEQALEDLHNLERCMAPGGMVAVHDTIPLDRETSARVRTTEFYTGDVWKVVAWLRRYRPELEIATVTAAPSGLTLIRGLAPERHYSAPDGSISTFAGLEFDYFERHRGEFLRTIPNRREAVAAFCRMGGHTTSCL
jgi:hypothetical protein